MPLLYWFWCLLGFGPKPKEQETQTCWRRWPGIIPKQDINGRENFDEFVQRDYRNRGCRARGYDSGGGWYNFRGTCKPGHCVECDSDRKFEREFLMADSQKISIEEKKLPDFDADVGPDNPINQEAANARGLRYDSESGVYRDSDGCLVRDRFGQDLG